MQASCPEEFHREHGFTEGDWLRCLPGAVRDQPIDLPQPGQALIRIGSGTLSLRWQVLAPRQIALVRLPRLDVHYRFVGVGESERHAFMRYFDLFMLRGGG
jgi:hypothetical protein